MIVQQRRVWLNYILLAVVSGCLCLGVKATESQGQQPSQTADRAVQLKSLLKERHDILSKAVVELTAQYKAGVTEFVDLAEAERHLFQATLELDDTPKARLAALQKQRDTANELFELATSRVKAGLTSTSEALQANAILLDARIAVLREEIKQQAGK